MLNRIELRPPYLLFVGDMRDRTYAKTALGIVHWCPGQVAGQLRLARDAVDLGVPDMDVAAAVQAGAGSLVIGVATVGGVIPDAWWDVIVTAARTGLDIVSGLHGRLADNPHLVVTANASGARLIDVRVPPQGLPVGTGRKRSGKRVLMVGTDCAVGKKYSALALNDALQTLGVKSTFRATGQTGIMIAGEGIPIDAVVADFVAGAAEVLSPDNDEDHWDVIEGQGSLFHPGYAGVSLALLHGSQPDAIVVCHDASRTAVAGWPDYALPGVAECMDLNLRLGRRTNSEIRCAGVSVNTSGLSEEDRAAYLDKLATEVALPCVDPVIHGCAEIARLLTG
jgi:D-glutamate N-acetyltransferase